MHVWGSGGSWTLGAVAQLATKIVMASKQALVLRMCFLPFCLLGVAERALRFPGLGDALAARLHGNAAGVLVGGLHGGRLIVACVAYYERYKQAPGPGQEHPGVEERQARHAASSCRTAAASRSTSASPM